MTNPARGAIRFAGNVLGLTLLFMLLITAVIATTTLLAGPALEAMTDIGIALGIREAPYWAKMLWLAVTTAIYAGIILVPVLLIGISAMATQQESSA